MIDRYVKIEKQLMGLLEVTVRAPVFVNISYSTRYMKSLSGTGYPLWNRLTAELGGIEDRVVFKNRVSTMINNEQINIII